MSLRFDAQSDGLSLPVALPTGPGGGRVYTLLGWIRLAVDRNGYSTPFDLSASLSNYGQFSTDGSGTLFGIHYSGGGVDGDQLTIDEWTCVAMASDGSTTTLYMGADPADLQEWTCPTPTGWNPSTLRIGYSVWSGEWWNGAIAGAKLWAAHLENFQVAAELTRAEPLVTAGIIGAWPGIELPGTADISGQNNTLTAGSTTPGLEDDPPWTPLPTGPVEPGAFLPFFPDRLVVT